MKKLFFLFLVALIFTSCKNTIYLNNLTYIPTVFDTIPAVSRGEFTASAELTFKKNIMVSKEQVKNYKQLSLLPKRNWSGAAGNASLGVSAIGMDGGNNSTARARRNQRRAARGNLRSMAKLASDPTYDKALYELISANPEIDYWTNIRVQRQVEGRKSFFLVMMKKLSYLPGFSQYANVNVYIKSGTEKVTVKATGIDLLTDKELQESGRK